MDSTTLVSQIRHECALTRELQFGNAPGTQESLIVTVETLRLQIMARLLQDATLLPNLRMYIDADALCRIIITCLPLYDMEVIISQCVQHPDIWKPELKLHNQNIMQSILNIDNEVHYAEFLLRFRPSGLLYEVTEVEAELIVDFLFGDREGKSWWHFVNPNLHNLLGLRKFLEFLLIEEHSGHVVISMYSFETTKIIFKSAKQRDSQSLCEPDTILEMPPNDPNLMALAIIEETEEN